ncbi:TlpA disulfide reductase family protein [Chitinophaga sp. sic0106]|uniref:TlpA disulfide reductase family protein n=1 Tax=Chitinophaga sp. sic0106 TaxID=2854785 RepID=UPI001C48A0F1|nr:TlpA disulfide reductase family protein [Chitinophaga sp. sic0106]MBV7531843.1 AhpC/TSA family protein [Chitinophaga sp. sic0106]
MKRFLLIMGTVLLSGAAFAQEVVSGVVKGGTGKYLYLFDDEDNNPDDSVLIKNDQFSFKVKAGKQPAIHALILQNIEYPMLFVTGEGAVHVVTTATTFPITSELKGGANTRDLQAYQKAFEPLIKKANDLNVEARGIAGSDEAGQNAFRKKAAGFGDEVVSVGTSFVNAHPKSVASIWLMLNELRNRLQPDAFKQLFAGLDKSVQNSKYGEMATAYIKSAYKNALGVAAEDFAQEDMKGQLVKLSSFKGKYVLVDFWASWCGPCRQENPNVVKAYNKYKDKNFTILGVSLDQDKARWLRAITQDGLGWTQVSDLKGWGNEVAVQYGIQSIPSNFLVDPAGNIIARNLRGEALEAKLAELLQ